MFLISLFFRRAAEPRQFCEPVQPLDNASSQREAERHRRRASKPLTSLTLNADSSYSRYTAERRACDETESQWLGRGTRCTRSVTGISNTRRKTHTPSK